MADPDNLAKYIRYQLSELAARNAHHEFEHLARHFARLRISERVIPATGPVGAGGDAGRDFETYRSYLASSPISESAFLSENGGQTLVFSCSIKKNVSGKIKSDLMTIANGSHSIHEVYYFCEENVAVGQRQKLQQFCASTYGFSLTIFDGQAIAESLASVELFWIAQKYLAVPSEMFPRPDTSVKWYEEAKKKWIDAAAAPASFADFIEIKSGLRRATFRKAYRADLPAWMKSIEGFRSLPNNELARRATYEICVAALRGLDDLTSRKGLVVEYFEKLSTFQELSELRDASVLLSYCSTAAASGHFEMSGAELHALTVALIRMLDEKLSTNPSPARKCELLEIRGSAESLMFRHGEKPRLDPAGMFAYWRKMLKIVPNAPLFPLDQFADVLTALAPYFSDDPRFATLAERTDVLVEKRTGAAHAAEKCRDRAVALLKSGKILLAIRQLHVAKIKWFAAETLRGTVLSMITIADCYLRLGLVYAAKQYSSAAARLVLQSHDDEIKELAATALRRHFDACYLAGEWFTCLSFANLVFASHNVFETNLYDLEEHEDVRNVLYHLTVIRLFARKELQEISAEANRMATEWQVDPDTAERLSELLEEAGRYWQQHSSDQLKESAEESLFGRPFSDVGRVRKIEWRALGVRWVIEFENERETVAVCEELLSTLQVLIADLGTSDLLLLPTKVFIEANLTTASELQVEALPSNDEAKWKVGLPRAWLDPNRDNSETSTQFVALASSVLGQASALSSSEFRARLGQALKAGLFDKIAAVRPTTELYLELNSEADYQRDVRFSLKPLFENSEFLVREIDELATPTSDGIGYTKEKSLEHIANRYRRAIRPIRHTLPRLVADADVRPRLRALKERGHKDWEIILLVANMAMNYRANLNGADSPAEMQKRSSELMSAEESEDSTPIPPSYFTEREMAFQLLVVASSMAKTWGLHYHRQTPDFAAMRRLLEMRYHILEDDIEHEEIFKD
jgi:hypothetical protein